MLTNEQLRDIYLQGMASFEVRLARLEANASGGGDGIRDREARDLVPGCFEPERDGFKNYSADVRNWITALTDLGGGLLNTAARGDDIDLDPARIP